MKKTLIVTLLMPVFAICACSAENTKYNATKVGNPSEIPQPIENCSIEKALEINPLAMGSNDDNRIVVEFNIEKWSATAYFDNGTFSEVGLSTIDDGTISSTDNGDNNISITASVDNTSTIDISVKIDDIVTNLHSVRSEIDYDFLDAYLNDTPSIDLDSDLVGDAQYFVRNTVFTDDGRIFRDFCSVDKKTMFELIYDADTFFRYQEVHCDCRGGACTDNYFELGDVFTLVEIHDMFEKDFTSHPRMSDYSPPPKTY